MKSLVLKWGSRFAGTIAVVIGCFWLAAWAAGLAPRWGASMIDVKTNMALAQVLAGVSLMLLCADPIGRARRLVGTAGGVLVLLIGSLTLSQHAFGYDLGIDQLLAKEPPGALATVMPNRMGPLGSLTLALIGAGLLACGLARRVAARCAGLAACLIQLVPAVGYLYGVEQFFSHAPVTGISWYTVVALMSLAVGLMIAPPQFEDGPLVLLLLRQDAGGILMRRFLPAVIVTPLALGFIGMLGRRQGLYDDAVGTGMLVIALMLIFSVLLWLSARRLSRTAKAQQAAEQALRESEAKYRTLFDNMTEGFALGEVMCRPGAKDCDFCFLEINKSFEHQTGLTRAILGKPITQVLPKLERYWAEKYCAVALGGKPAHFDAPNADTGRHYEVFCYSPSKGRFAIIFTDISERKRAEEALRANERRVRAFFESDMMGALYWNMDGQITDANDKFLEMIGYSREDLVNGQISWDQLTPPEYRAADEHALDELRSTGVDTPYEKEYIRKDGTRMPIYIGAAMLDEKRYEGVAFVLDISKRKRAEAALRESRERLRLAASAARLFAFEWDPVTDKVRREGDAPAILGVDFQEETGKTFFERIHPEDRRKFVELVQSLRPDCDAYTTIYRTIGPGGREVVLEESGRAFFDETGRFVRLIGMTADITKRRRAEEGLAESEERLRLAKSAGQIGIHDYNPVTGALHWDGRVRELWGLGPEDPVNYEVFLSAIHEEDRAATHAAVQHALDPSGDGNCHVEFRLVRDGRTRWIAATGQATFQNGRAVRLIGTVQDTTERKEFQAELERLIAERTAKLQELVGELEHFSYTITHDMRAPLRAMKGYGEVVLDLCKEWGKNEATEFLQRILTAADRMDALIRDALNYSQSVRQELPLENVDLGKLLRGMLDSYPEFQPSRAQIKIDGELPRVLGNEAALTQCFSNLIGNAVKFVKPGQMPEIRIWSEIIHATDLPKTVLSEGLQPHQRGRIWVEDNGVGISREMMPRVFEMFARASKSYEGTGIGLALVRKVAHRMGGKAGVESELGKGSRFWVELWLGSDPLKS